MEEQSYESRDKDNKRNRGGGSRALKLQVTEGHASTASENIVASGAFTVNAPASSGSHGNTLAVSTSALDILVNTVVGVSVPLGTVGAGGRTEVLREANGVTTLITFEVVETGVVEELRAGLTLLGRTAETNATVFASPLLGVQVHTLLGTLTHVSRGVGTKIDDGNFVIAI
jgi:hypothetical protein